MDEFAKTNQGKETAKPRAVVNRTPPKIRLLKKSDIKTDKYSVAAATDEAPANLVLVIDDDGAITICGERDEENIVDIAALAKLAKFKSDNMSVVKVIAPTAMSFREEKTGLGVALVTVELTYNDAARGVCTITDAISVVEPVPTAPGVEKTWVLNHGAPSVFQVS